jgi:hypothetical protein
VTQRFGSLDRLRAQMLGAAKAASGWIVLVADGASHKLEIVQTENHAMGGWSASPLLVLDAYEHAYAIDYGANKPGYFDALWRNVGWNAVHERATRALARGQSARGRAAAVGRGHVAPEQRPGGARRRDLRGGGRGDRRADRGRMAPARRRSWSA